MSSKIGKTYMLSVDEELWEKTMPEHIQKLVQSNDDNDNESEYDSEGRHYKRSSSKLTAQQNSFYPRHESTNKHTHIQLDIHTLTYVDLKW